MIWHSPGANVNLSSSSRYEQPDFWWRNWFDSDTHPCWQPHTLDKSFVHCLAMTDPKLSWGRLLTWRKKCFSSEKTQSKMPMSSSIDLVIITLICSKQKSQSVSSIWRHKLVFCWDCQFILKYGVRDGDDVDDGADLTFQKQRCSWRHLNNKY